MPKTQFDAGRLVLELVVGVFVPVKLARIGAVPDVVGDEDAGLVVVPIPVLATGVVPVPIPVAVTASVVVVAIPEVVTRADVEVA